MQYKIRQYLLTIPHKLPANTLSPLSMDWPLAPTFLAETSRLLRAIYHRWKCYLYRSSFDQTSRNRMREKVTASIIFKERKASYPRRYVIFAKYQPTNAIKNYCFFVSLQCGSSFYWRLCALKTKCNVEEDVYGD